MDQICRETLEAANKLIFVRRYSEAERLLGQCLLLPGCANESLVHLRRIELMSLLGRLEELHQHYSRISPSNDSNQILLTLVEMFMNSDEQASNLEIISELQVMYTQNGPSACLCFALGYASEQEGNPQRAAAYYEQSLALDRDWYPSVFGLSQVHYNMSDQAKGDQFFRQFEMMAPFNVYGNFETHRRLSRDFFVEGRFDEAELAIQMLTNWWIDSKGYAPGEIQVFENLATAQIAEAQGNLELGSKRRAQAGVVTQELLKSSLSDENILFFLARILEEFGEQKLSFQSYKHLLRVAGDRVAVVQNVGSHFLGQGDFQAAKELFEGAYEEHPNNNEVRFCLLVSRLKAASVNVEEYLSSRERIRLLVEHGDRVELLGLLNSLMKRFQDDSDVHFHLAEIFLKMGHPTKAHTHFARMHELDPKGQVSGLRYANFLMNHAEADKAMGILEGLRFSAGKMTEVAAEVQWLRVSYFDRKSKWVEAAQALRPLLDRDPWNITYLVQEIVNLTGIQSGESGVADVQNSWAKKLNQGEEQKVNWSEFSKDTDVLEEQHSYALVYARCKLHYLYMRGSEQVLRSVVKGACLHDAARGAKEFMRLLNTNFDSPSVYWGLGLVYKELWQLEVASMWFEQALQCDGLGDREKSLLYVDLADTFTWRNQNLPKAIEYCRLSLDLGVRTPDSEHYVMKVMSHALLRHGQPRQALAFLEQLQKDQDSSFEVRYLAGLVHYRNGHPREANEIWKPLLKFQSVVMRDHKIKQEILKYYFEATPYIPRDLSRAN